MPLDPESFRTEIVRETYRYWLSKCADDRLPSRADIRVEEIPRLMPYLFLVDVAQEPLSFRFRLVGTAISALAGREFTGVAVSEAEYGGAWQRIHDDYATAVRTRTAHHADATAPWGGREFLHYERIVAPLAADGRTIDMLFGALHPTEPLN